MIKVNSFVTIIPFAAFDLLFTDQLFSTETLSCEVKIKTVGDLDEFFKIIYWSHDEILSSLMLQEMLIFPSGVKNWCALSIIYWLEIEDFCGLVSLRLTLKALRYGLHFRHGMWLTREPPSRFYFCFNLLNSISTSICWISCLLSIGEIVISRFIFSRFFISIFLLTSLDLSPTLGFVSYSRMMDPGTRPGVPKNILIDVLLSQKSAVCVCVTHLNRCKTSA